MFTSMRNSRMEEFYLSDMEINGQIGKCVFVRSTQFFNSSFWWLDNVAVSSTDF